MAVIRGWFRVIAAALLVLFLLLAAASYTIIAIVGQASVTWPQFAGMLAVLTLANMWLLLSIWKKRASLSPVLHIAFILWGGVAIWYWTFAPLYYSFSMNLNALQLTWTTFAFLWEVPVIGGILFAAIGLYFFRPILRAVSGKDLSAAEAEKAYRQVLRYPRRIAITLFCLSVIGYVIGAIQLDVFAGISQFELIKSVSNGPVVSIFLAVFYYLILDTYFDQFRRLLSQRLPSNFTLVRSLRWRLATVSVAVLLGGVGLLGLLVVESFQRFTEQLLQAEVQEDIVRIREALVENPQADLQLYARGPEGFVQRVSGAVPDSLLISAETEMSLREQAEGVVTDLHERGKVLGFFTPAGSSERIVSVVYLTPFYDFLQLPEFVTYGLSSLIVVVLTTGIFMFVMYEITRALVSLRVFAKEPKVANWNELAGVHAADEIEAVGRSFMRYVQKAAETDEVKRGFVSLASHQLRTPLTTIRWYVELLAGEHEGPLNQKQREDLQRISQGSQRMLQLVNSLLNVSRIDSGRLNIKPQATDLAAFIRTLIEEVAPPAKEVECEFEVHEQAKGARVWVDQMVLRQVMQNLLTNALKYRSPERTCQVVVALQRDTQQQFVIIVEDNGVGIPQHQQHRVFDRFFRADNVAVLDTEGTGLGLYVSKMLLAAAGCEITFTSREGHGTTFYITIPKDGMLAKPGEIGLANEEVLDNPPTTNV